MRVVASTSRRVTWNLILTGAGQMLTLLNQIALVPIFLRAWGEVLYGDWMTISAVATYFSLADFGMQMYAVNVLTGHWTRGEHDKFRETLGSTLMFYSYTTVVGLTCAVVLAAVLGWSPAAALRFSHFNSALVALCLTAGIVVSLWCGFIGAIHRAFGEPERTTGFAVLYRILQLMATFTALYSGVGPTGLAAILFVVPVAVGLYVARDLRTRRPTVRFSFGGATRGSVLRLIAPSISLALILLAQGLVLQGSVITVSAILGSAAVTTFATSRTMANAVRQLTNLPNLVFWPEFTRLDASGSTRSLALAHRVLVKLTSIAALWAAGILAFLGPAIYDTWTRRRAHLDKGLFYLLVALVLLQTPWLSSSMLLMATNRHKNLSILQVAQSVVAISLSPIAVSLFGLRGIAIVLIVTELPLLGIMVPLWAQRVLGEPAHWYFSGIYAPMFAFALLTWIAGWAAHQFLGSSHWAFIVLPIVISLTTVIAAYLWLDSEERSAVLRPLRLRRM